MRLLWVTHKGETLRSGTICDECHGRRSSSRKGTNSFAESAAAADLQLAGPDAHLLTMRNALLDEWEEEIRLSAARDEQWTASADRAGALVRRMIEIRAFSLAGLQAKAMAVAYCQYGHGSVADIPNDCATSRFVAAWPKYLTQRGVSPLVQCGVLGQLSTNKTARNAGGRSRAALVAPRGLESRGSRSRQRMQTENGPERFRAQRAAPVQPALTPCRPTKGNAPCRRVDKERPHTEGFVQGRLE
jgi:hypothetical protein